ncbi:MFS transporter [Kitasatospora sp. NPDC059571]|uniref:MFS transporter n=1 Tax=Kitasatospora sp. NPDC059571 TaxID=3346871 RepID=UPI0036B3F0D4
MPGYGLVVPLLILIEFASGMLQGAVPILLPQLAGSAHLGAGDQALVTGVEFLVSGVAVPLTSRLGDLYGHRRLLRITAVLCTAGFAVTAQAASLGGLLAGRGLCGFLACWLPLEFALLRDRLGADRGGRAIGLLVGSLTLGAVAGAVAAGTLATDPGMLRPTLWGLVALPALALLVLARRIPESTTRADGRMDWPGAALLSLGLLVLFGGLGGAGRAGGPLTAGCFAAAAVLLALFVRRELRTGTPMVDLRVLAGRTTGPVFVLSFLLGCVLYGSQAPTLAFQAAVPAEAGYGLGADSQTLGLLTLPSVLGATLGAVAADRLARRFGARPALVGAFALATAGYASITAVHGSALAFAVPGALTGFGAGIALSLLPGLLLHRLPAHQTGIGTGVYNTLKTLAGAATGAVAAALLDTVLLRPGLPSEGAYTAVWAGCTLLAAGGVAVAAALRQAPAAGPVADARPVPAAQAG